MPQSIRVVRQVVGGNLTRKAVKVTSHQPSPVLANSQTPVQ